MRMLVGLLPRQINTNMLPRERERCGGNIYGVHCTEYTLRLGWWSGVCVYVWEKSSRSSRAASATSGMIMAKLSINNFYRKKKSKVIIQHWRRETESYSVALEVIHYPGVSGTQSRTQVTIVSFVCQKYPLTIIAHYALHSFECSSKLLLWYSSWRVSNEHR